MSAGAWVHARHLHLHLQAQHLLHHQALQDNQSPTAGASALMNWIVLWGENAMANFACVTRGTQEKSAM